MPHTVGTYIKANLGINANVQCNKKCHVRWVYLARDSASSLHARVCLLYRRSFCVCRTRKHTQKRARTHTHMQAHTCTRAHTRTRTHMSYRCISCIIVGVQAHLEHLKAPSQWAKDHAEDATSITIPSEKPRLFCLHGAQSVAPYRVRFHVGEGVGVGVWVRGLARVSSASML